LAYTDAARLDNGARSLNLDGTCKDGFEQLGVRGRVQHGDPKTRRIGWIVPAQAACSPASCAV
jgi:hypothetical protein